MSYDSSLSNKRHYKSVYGKRYWAYNEGDIKRAVKELIECDMPFQWISGGCDEEHCRKIWKDKIKEIFGERLI